MALVYLNTLAHGRSGDKGDTSNVCVFARDPKDYEFLKRVLTVERVKEYFGDMVKGEIIRYDVDTLCGMNFVMNDLGMPKDNSYELFFIDAKGHVLNERQLLEIKGGKLSTERVQFCLNTRDDSGDQYELMIRESGQDDYEVVARLPFKAKLAFAGTDSFDF